MKISFYWSILSKCIEKDTEISLETVSYNQ